MFCRSTSIPIFAAPFSVYLPVAFIVLFIVIRWWSRSVTCANTEASFLFVANQVLDRFARLVAFRPLCIDHRNNVCVLNFAELQGVLLISLFLIPEDNLVAGMRLALRLFLIFYWLHPLSYAIRKVAGARLPAHLFSVESSGAFARVAALFYALTLLSRTIWATAITSIGFFGAAPVDKEDFNASCVRITSRLPEREQTHGNRVCSRLLSSAIPDFYNFLTAS